MKRFIIAAAIAALSLLPMVAGVLDPVFDKYRKLDNAEYVHIPKFLMMMAGDYAKIDKDLPITGKASGVKVLSIDDCSANTLAEIEQSIRKTATEKDMDEIIRTTSYGEQCQIWFESKGDKIKSIYILAMEKDELDLVEISGNFKLTDNE